MGYVIPTPQEIQHYFQTGEHPWPVPNKKHKVSHKTKAGILRTKIIMNELILLLEVDRIEFENKFIDKEPSNNHLPHSSQSVLRWLRGENTLTPLSLKTMLQRIIKSKKTLDLKVPQDLEEKIWNIFHSPFFYLLQNKPLSKKKINEALKPYTHKDEPMNWCFPDDYQLYKQDMYVPMNGKEDSASLFKKGGFHCFIVLTGLVRLAEREKNTQAHMEHMYWVYSSLPELVRSHELQEYWEELLEIVIEIHSRDFVSAEFMRPKKEIIKSLIFGPEEDISTLKHPFDDEWNDLDIEWPVEKAKFSTES